MTDVIEVLEREPFGNRVDLLRTGEDNGDELLEMEVAGRPRVLSQRHVHPLQVERLEVVSGAMKVTMNGRDFLIGEGHSIEIPAGIPHTQTPMGEGPGRVRIQVCPAGPTRAFSNTLPSSLATGRSCAPATRDRWRRPSWSCGFHRPVTRALPRCRCSAWAGGCGR